MIITSLFLGTKNCNCAFRNIVIMAFTGLSIALSATSALATEGKVGYSQKITNQTGVKVNDLHLIFDLPGGVMIPGPKDALTDDQGLIKEQKCVYRNSGEDPNDTSSNRMICDVTFKRDLVNGEMFTITLQDKSKKGAIKPKSGLGFSWWTFNGQKVIVPGAPDDKLSPLSKALGFESSGVGNKLSYTLFNDNSIDVLVSDLQFSITPNEPEQLLPFTLPGFTPSLPDFTLLAGQSITFSEDVFAGSQPSDFLLAQMKVSSINDPTDFTFIMHEAQICVPEPSFTISFLALGTLGAASTLKRKLKPSQSTEKETTKVG